MQIKQIQATHCRSPLRCFVLLYLICGLLILSGTGITAQQNQTLLNHQRSRNFNREGYRAYRAGNWDLALSKFARSIKLDPYYTYPLYNMASVLSLRGRPQDAFRIYRLLLEVLLQESEQPRSAHQAKMQKDPDLAWFRRHEPELFIMLNNVVLNYDKDRVYRKLRRRQSWEVETLPFRRADLAPIREQRWQQNRTIAPDFSNDDEIGKTEVTALPEVAEQASRPAEIPENSEKANPDIGYTVPLEERRNSITVTPDDEPFDPDSGNEQLFGGTSEQDAPNFITPDAPYQFSDDFDPFSGVDFDHNPFDDPDSGPLSPPDFDEEGNDGFFPFVPQSLRQEYEGSRVTLRLVRQQARPLRTDSGSDSALYQDQIAFQGYRYRWRFQAGGKLFELRGFFVIRGNVLVLETFASNPKELESLPFDWNAFRSLFFIYQAHIDEFHAITTAGEQVRIY